MQQQQQQTINDIQQLLQQKIFGHPWVKHFNPYSRAGINKTVPLPHRRHWRTSFKMQ